MNNIPKISVIMGLYNCEKTLQESIDSLLNQTFQDFELIMCDDGSIDKTYKIAETYKEIYNNIILLKNDKNKGLNYTLNYCLKYARGEYIARQDADDFSLNNRFEEEIKYLESHTNVAFIGCQMIQFDKNGDFKIAKAIEYPQKKHFAYGNPFYHPTCIIRKSIMSEANGYSEEKYFKRGQDYNLWFKIYARGYVGYNIQKPLYKYRDDSDAYKRRNFKSRLYEVYNCFIGFHMLKLPFYYYIFCFRPVIVGLLPRGVYNFFHRMNGKT
jgi:glycosyltransferase EpsE